jgi:hypothetical protein
VASAIYERACPENAIMMSVDYSCGSCYDLRTSVRLATFLRVKLLAACRLFVCLDSVYEAYCREKIRNLVSMLPGIVTQVDTRIFFFNGLIIPTAGARGRSYDRFMKLSRSTS